MTENGYGKRTRVAEYPRKGRGGMGVKTIQLTEAKGKLAGARVVRDGYQVMLISTGGTVIRMPVEDVKRLGRSTQGVIVMRLREGERVSALAPVVESDESSPTSGVRASDARRPRTRAAGRRPTRAEFERDFARNALLKARRRAVYSRVGVVPTRQARGSTWLSADRLTFSSPSISPSISTRSSSTSGQVCQIAGISKMQLDYWTNKAQIPTKGKKQRIYDIDALETVMLIKQAKDKGLNLGAAIEAARRFRESSSSQRPADESTRVHGVSGPQAPPPPRARSG